MTGFQILLMNSIDTFFKLLYFLIMVRIILSWLPISRSNSIIQLIYTLTEPVLGPIRSMIESSPIGGGMMLDFSPVIALFVMNIIKMVLIGIVSFL